MTIMKVRAKRLDLFAGTMIEVERTSASSDIAKATRQAIADRYAPDMDTHVGRCQ
jgi:hypothetical protein